MRLDIVERKLVLNIITTLKTVINKICNVFRPTTSLYLWARDFLEELLKLDRIRVLSSDTEEFSGTCNPDKFWLLR